MKYLLPLLISLIIFEPAYSQNVDYDSAEDLIHDIQSRNFSKPITFLKFQLDSIEKNSSDLFPDSMYIDMVGLLCTAYVQTDKAYEADSLLNHSLNYMISTRRTSPYAYALYVVYGGLLCQMQNFNKASMYLKTATDILTNQDEKGENYAVITSMLAVCHLNMDSLVLAKQEIDESISIIEKISSRYTISNKMGIYQKAGAIYHGLGLLEKAEEYTKLAYNLSKEDDIYVSEFINAAYNLSSIYADSGRYSEALSVLHHMEKLPLSEIEKSNVYNNIFLH